MPEFTGSESQRIRRIFILYTSLLIYISLFMTSVWSSSEALWTAHRFWLSKVVLLGKFLETSHQNVYPAPPLERFLKGGSLDCSWFHLPNCILHGTILKDLSFWKVPRCSLWFQLCNSLLLKKCSGLFSSPLNDPNIHNRVLLGTDSFKNVFIFRKFPQVETVQVLLRNISNVSISEPFFEVHLHVQWFQLPNLGLGYIFPAESIQLR